MKPIYGAVVGVMAMAFAGAGLAQESSEVGSPGAPTSSSVPAAPNLSNSYKSSDLIGMNVVNDRNENLGSISDLIVDKSGMVSNVVLNEGGITNAAGNKYVIPWSRVQVNPSQDVAVVNVSKNALPSEFAAFEEGMTAPVTKAPGSTTPPSGTPPSGSSVPGSSGDTD